MIKKTFTGIIVFITVIFYSGKTFGQNYVTVEVSQVFSTFRFMDSQGALDKNYSHVMTTASGIGYRMTTKKNVLFRVNLGLRKAGSTLKSDQDNYSWTFNYVDLKLGAGYILNKWKLKPYALASFYYAYLLKANETINSENYDIKKASLIKTSDFGAVGTLGLKYDLNTEFSVFGEYNYLLGLQNNETSGKQKSYNRAYSFSLGIAIKISKKSHTWIQEKE